MAGIIFPKDFLWGAGTSSYQIEGAWKEAGKGESVWDVFSHIPGKVDNNENGDIACDHYHRYEEDILLMKELGLKVYRFSINWPRLFPKGFGEPNIDGMRFYDNLINGLLENGITPLVTLYHWELPQALMLNGGWENRETAEVFADYAEFCFRAYGDRVKKWTTFNEAWIVAFEGYVGKGQPPADKSNDHFAECMVSHHINIAHAKAVERFREVMNDGEIGIAQVIAPVYPDEDTKSNKAKALIADGILNRWYMDPLFFGKYPEDIISFNKQKYNFEFKPDADDLKFIKDNPCDYIGINHYSPFRAQDNGKDKLFDWAGCMWVGQKPERKYTGMNWEIEPQGIYDSIMRLHKDYGKPKLYITENGAAFDDENIVDGVVQDDNRVDFYKGYISACARAVQEGANLKGYLVWSLMDNFEWCRGYSKRFGIVRVDFATQKRTIKKSGRWYAAVIKNNGFEI